MPNWPVWECLLFKRAALVAAILFLGFTHAATADTRLHFEAPDAPEDLADALRGASLVLSAGADAEAQDLFAAARADYAQLLGVLYENAYYGGVIQIRVDGREAASIPPLAAPGQIERVVIQVRAGPLYRFNQARITPVAPRTELPEEFQSGAAAGTGTIRDAATSAVTAWRAIGHAKADVARQDIVAQHDARRVDARIGLDPGPRLTFGAVGVSGNEDVSTRRIRTIAGVTEGLSEGRVFDPIEVERAATRLRRTGSFSSVSIEEAEQIGPNNTLPLNIAVVEATPRRFGVGAEFSTTEGLGLSGFWLHRNFLGGAERFRIDGSLSGIGGETGGVDYELGVRYERPATPRADVDLFAELNFEALDEPDFKSDTTEFSLGFTRYATDTLTVEFGLGYLFSDTEDAFERETFQLFTLPLAAELDRRNNSLDPTSGFFVDLEVTPFLALAGTTDGALIELDSRAYRQRDRLTFAGRLQLGSLFGPALTESPPFYRFFSGGGGTVRGQGFQSLALEVDGNRTGGRSFLGLSGELRRDITEEIQIVGFADWGYVGRESFPDFSGESHAGAGLGVRYKTGIGPIRLDVGVPVAGDTDGSSLYLYVGIGQAF
ncbi:MAG: BamA/TamA family outer membrane protein [Pseudomonadota bacterium]